MMKSTLFTFAFLSISCSLFAQTTAPGSAPAAVAPAPAASATAYALPPPHPQFTPPPGANYLGQNVDSLELVKAKDTVSSGPKKLHYANGAVLAEGSLVNWKREGWWSIYREDGSKASEVLFKLGEGMEMKAFDENGKLTGTSSTVEADASFEGGDPGWNTYLQQAIISKEKYLAKKNAGGKIEVQFVIEKDGSVGEVELIKRSGTAFDEVVVDIIKKSPRWTPANQYNRNVKAFRKQKLNYSVSVQ